MFLAKTDRFATRLLYARIIDSGMFMTIWFLKNARGQRFIDYILDPTMEGLPIPRSDASAIIRELVEEVISMVSSLQEKAGEKETPVCFVLDGEPLPAKALTHKSRAIKSRSCLKKARKLARLFLAKPNTVRVQNEVAGQFLRKFRACASGWVRWFKELKDLVVKSFQLWCRSRI